MRIQLHLPNIFTRTIRVCALLLLCVFITACGNNEPKAEKLRVKMVDIRGTKVRLPIPDGYEEMQREDQPERFDWLVEVTTSDRMTPLAYFIHSEDKKRLKVDQGADFRYGFALSTYNFWDAVVHDNTMRHIRNFFVEHINGLNEGANEVAEKKGHPIVDYTYIHEGIKSISCIRVPRTPRHNKKYITARTVSYIVVDKRILSINLYMNIHDKSDIERLKTQTVNYLTKVDHSLYMHKP